ncbi:MAG: hypothetical protein OXP37_00795 [Chloroflexota bacterium]|nr:hypothetical protein [Chloroflexota bacterium]
MANISPADGATSGHWSARPTPAHCYPAARIDLGQLANSHGWRTLAPFNWDQDGLRLETAAVISGRAVAIDVSQSGSGVLAEAWGDVGRGELDAVVKRMLWTDLDLAEFHVRCRRQKRYRGVAENGEGRLLRSPTLWEDLVKVLATTNISWSGTRAMTSRLVGALGEPAPLGRTAFPGPEAVARVSADELAAESGFGYRAGSLRRIAQLIAEGRLDPDSWERPDRSDRAVAREILGLPGVGPYALACIMALCGRFGHLPIDSVFRSRHPDSEVALRHYRSWGRWKYLAYWFGRKT